MPLKEQVFLQVSLVDCKQSVVCSLVLRLKHRNLRTHKSYKTKNSSQRCVRLDRTPQKNSSEREEKHPPSHVLLLTEHVCNLTGETHVLLASRAAHPALSACGCMDRGTLFVHTQLVAVQQEDSAATQIFLEEAVSGLVFTSISAFVFFIKFLTSFL